MTEEEKYRVEHPDDVKTEHGLAKPLPHSQETTESKGRATPIVAFLGISMRESMRDWVVMVFTPFLAAVIETAILAYQIVFFQELNAGIFLIVCVALALPVGIIQPTSSRALTSGVLNAMFLCLCSMLFIASPALFAPSVVPLDEFLLMSTVFMLGYFALAIPSCILGSYMGHIIREIL